MHMIKRTNTFALMNIFFGLIGWFASFNLLREYIHSIQNKDYEPGCNISILVTCGPNMESWQGSLFGFSNTILGVALFVVPIVIGFSLILGVKIETPIFLTFYSIGMTGALAFVLWLSYQSIFSLGTLCPWCMIIWSVTIPLSMFSYSYTSAAFKKSNYRDRSSTKMNILIPLLLTFVLILMIAFIAQNQLDWFAEIRRSIL